MCMCHWLRRSPPLWQLQPELQQLPCRCTHTPTLCMCHWLSWSPLPCQAASRQSPWTVQAVAYLRLLTCQKRQMQWPWKIS